VGRSLQCYTFSSQESNRLLEILLQVALSSRSSVQLESVDILLSLFSEDVKLLPLSKHPKVMEPSSPSPNQFMKDKKGEKLWMTYSTVVVLRDELKALFAFPSPKYSNLLPSLKELLSPSSLKGSSTSSVVYLKYCIPISSSSSSSPHSCQTDEWNMDTDELWKSNQQDKELLRMVEVRANQIVLLVDCIRKKLTKEAILPEVPHAFHFRKHVPLK
jgi:hypothetical protein